MTEHNNNLVLFSGSSNFEKLLNWENLGDAYVGRFSDQELNVRIDEHVRGMDVYIAIYCFPVNENLMELLIMIDALRRSSASRITAVIPYFGYADKTGE